MKSNASKTVLLEDTVTSFFGFADTPIPWNSSHLYTPGHYRLISHLFSLDGFSFLLSSNPWIF